MAWGAATVLNDDGNGPNEQAAIDRMAISSRNLLSRIGAAYPHLVPKPAMQRAPEPPAKPRQLWPDWYAPPVRTHAKFAKDIITEVGEHFGFGYHEMVGPSQRRSLSRARQTAYMVLRARGNSCPQIGRWMNRDHSTVVYGCQMFPTYAKHEPRMQRVLDMFADAS